MNDAKAQGKLILFLGANWWGSDARALAVALRSSGHNLIEVNYQDFLSTHWSSWYLRVLRRAIRPLLASSFNEAVLQHAGNPAIDFLLVFKGMLLNPRTLAYFRSRKIPAYCFYPDVSFSEHGGNIWQCLPFYDCLFTTKEFHVRDPILRQRVKDIQLVSHGFDPEVHRPTTSGPLVLDYYACDVSFVGCWSPKKERLIASLVTAIPRLTLKLWGPGWNRAQPPVRQRWSGRGAYGDELAVIYQASRINLGLLSEAGSDTGSGDEVTARTWQIPATTGFLLHEQTSELERYFISGREVATFQDAADLPLKVQYYLNQKSERDEIARRGYERCLTSGYTYSIAAKTICDYHAGITGVRENAIAQ